MDRIVEFKMDVTWNYNIQIYMEILTAEWRKFVFGPTLQQQIQ